MKQITKDEQLFTALLSENKIRVKRFNFNREVIVGEGILKEYTPFFIKLDNQYFIRKSNMFFLI